MRNVYRHDRDAGERILSYQVSDWVFPLPETRCSGAAMMATVSIEAAPDCERP